MGSDDEEYTVHMHTYIHVCELMSMGVDVSVWMAMHIVDWTYIVPSVQCPVSPSLGLSMAARWRNVLERLLAQMNEHLDLAEVVLGLVARWAVAEDRSTTIRVIGVLRLARRDRARWLSVSTLEAMARVGRDD